MGALSISGGMATTRLTSNRSSAPPAKSGRKETKKPVVTATRRGRLDGKSAYACRDEDPELFFPIGTTGPYLLQVEQAKAVCRRCSLVEECLAWALESGQDTGVWGGMSEEERRAFKRRGGLQELQAWPT